VLTFNTAQTGTVQIVGARRPRRTSQFQENVGVPTRNFNVVLSDIIAMLREVWDKINDVTGRAIVGQPGETLPPLAPAATRAGQFLCFTSIGQPTTCPVVSGSGTLQPGTGISLSGSNPTVISTNLTAGNGISISGATISVAPSTNIQTGNYTIQPSDCNKTVQVGTGATGQLGITLPTVSGPPVFPEGCEVTVVNGDTTNGKILGGFPSGFANTVSVPILWPTKAGVVQVINGAWKTIQPEGRWKLIATAPGQPFNVFTNYSTGVDNNDCLTVATACMNGQHALDLACNDFDLSGLSAAQTEYTVNFANGAVDANGIHWPCNGVLGAQGGASIVLTGPVGGSATINPSPPSILDAVSVFTGAQLSVNNLTIGTNNGQNCVRTDYGGRIFFGTGNTFSVCSLDDFVANGAGSTIILQGSYNVQGNSGAHFHAINGGVIMTDIGNTIATFSAGLTFSQAIAEASSGGLISVPLWTAAGTPPTATKTVTTGTGAIFTGAGTSVCNGSFFPGTTNGSVASPFCN
jgi:hypothetical protein